MAQFVAEQVLVVLQASAKTKCPERAAARRHEAPDTLRDQ
jgi:hypothetical protein